MRINPIFSASQIDKGGYAGGPVRLDHFVAKHTSESESAARLAIAQGRVTLDGEVSRDHLSVVDSFCTVARDGELLQRAWLRTYLMLHKPVGYISATRDREHPTALDLIAHPAADTLHIAGRLDRSSSGLLLLTNDSAWSEALTHPEQKVAKTYLVETQQPISSDAEQRFAEGFYFEYEGITTKPALLERLGDRRARVTLEEGKYHQIKRMFHRLDGNRLVSLHRTQIGSIRLPAELQAGQWRELTEAEVSQHCV